MRKPHDRIRSERTRDLDRRRVALLMAAYRSTITLSDLSDVVAAAHEIQQLFNRDTAWWRGHAKVDWRLKAQVYRQDPSTQNVGYMTRLV